VEAAVVCAFHRVQLLRQPATGPLVELMKEARRGRGDSEGVLSSECRMDLAQLSQGSTSGAGGTNVSGRLKVAPNTVADGVEV